MKKLSLLLLLSHLVIFPVKGDNTTATVNRISDGDTLNITLTGTTDRIRIRFGCIDAPEINHGQGAQPYGPEAQANLYQLVKPGDVVQLQTWGTDHYGRPVGLVFINGKNLNLEQVRAGLAWSTTQQYACPITGEIDQAEQEARAAGRGLWSQPNPENPREFRHRGN